MTAVSVLRDWPPRTGAWLSTVSTDRTSRWVLAVSAAGWFVMVAHAVSAFAATAAEPRGHDMMHMGGAMPGMGHAASYGSLLGAGAGGLMWGAMLAATMLPLVAPNVQYAVRRSPCAQRAATAVAVLVGWGAVWGAALVMLGVGVWMLVAAAGRGVAVVVVFGAAAGWECTRLKRVSVIRCHRVYAPPLIPRDAVGRLVRYGAGLGADCATSCWALMAAMAVCGHALWVVGPLGWVSFYERRVPHHVSARAVTVPVIVVVGAAASLAAMA